MKAIVSERPGPVTALAVTDVPQPVVPDDGVLVRVRASSANPVDLFPTSPVGHFMSRKRKPLILGTDFAGTVEAVGKDVTKFRAGDDVFGGEPGAFAELVCVKQSGAIVPKPAGVSFEHAGTVAVAATTALQALRAHGRVQAGQRVLINGASGGVGTFAVQIACALGADVTAVCNTHNVEMVHSLGARTVIDYRKEDFTRGDALYDLVVDIAGSHSLRECRRVMRPQARFVLTGAAAVIHRRGGTLLAIGRLLGTKMRSMVGGDRVTTFIAALNNGDLEFLAGLLASGRVVAAIDRRYDLSETGAALAYLNEGHARAKIAIAVV